VLDVRDAGAVQAWLAALPAIDVVVNNAGGTFHALFETVSPKGQTSVVDENFTSVTHVIRASLPLLRDGGSIINITSVEAYRAAPGFGIYGAMKAAVEHLTRTLALELSDRRIRVNCIAPDSIPTPGDEELQIGGDYGWKVPLGLGSPDDIVGAAVFLASDASRFITGTTIHVDGGTDAARGWRRGPDGWEP
jgi:NAD(P)-dependent dehydrogenase (short-subunit alcohol dehydrogenase family)